MDHGRRSESLRETVRSLRRESTETNERRLVVLSGRPEATRSAAKTVADVGSFRGTIVSVSDRDVVGDRVEPRSINELLGTTNDCVVVDCHAACRPNVIGAATGTVDGGGLLVLLVPPLEAWPETECGLERMLAAPPFSVDDVGTRFKRRLVRTLRSHRGVAIFDVETNRLLKSGRTDPAPRQIRDRVVPPETHSFPSAVYEACLTADQRDAVHSCERLSEGGNALVLEADRGRGKSSAAGLAAAAFAADGCDVLVTAPTYGNARELFDRAVELLDSVDALAEDRRGESDPPALYTTAGTVRFHSPQVAADSSADVLFVDEAAALPVRTLEELLSVAPSACFTTTVRGYEGTGRGFEIRFRNRLESARTVTSVTLSEPIRYAPADPVEIWLFHALLLGATPAATPLVESASPKEASYERLDRDSLAAAEPLLGEVFGLLVAAHYRTEPSDLARLLDAPNVVVRALSVGGHVASVALLSLEGGLDAATRQAAYEGERIHGNLVPDLLTSQLRDPDAGVPVGLRVMRIATHDAVRSSGFGSKLLEAIESEFRPNGSRRSDRFGAVDYLSTSYGATPELLRFWRQNGYATVHLSATRNDRSGEHSAVMLRALSSDGDALVERHEEWFRSRLPDALGEVLDTVDPDVIRGVLASTNGSVRTELSDFEWRLVASAAYGPGQYDVAPGPFRRLAFRALLDGLLEDAETERLLVVKVLQRRGWEPTAESLDYVSKRACMRALGNVFRPIVAEYGTETAMREADRYRKPK